MVLEWEERSMLEVIENERRFEHVSEFKWKIGEPSERIRNKNG